ncbi:MAG: hypothetical protein JXL80_10750 [Planctomycetes bacterium]|nr:hypothetical protein [Planctomycetota bacterium]
MFTDRLARMLLAAALVALAAPGCNPFSRGDQTIAPDFDRYIGKEPPQTFLLAEYKGTLSRNDAERVRQELVEKGLPKAFVIADDDEAFLCYGLYEKGRESKDYPDDQQQLARVRDAQGRPIFGVGLGSQLMLLPETTPYGRYDLQESTTAANQEAAKANKLPKHYTVNVGTFSSNVYHRKHMAVDFAESLRRRGQEAYVFHGGSYSHVTVGLFDNTIFDDWHRFANIANPAKIVSPEVQRILAAMPYQNLDGHQITAEEARQVVEAEAEAEAEARRKGQQYRGGVYRQMILSKVVEIPGSRQ